MDAAMPALTPADLELLSAYLDNELTPAERAALERRLAAEPGLAAELDALRGVVAQARALPLLKAPRDFRLNPAVYGRPAAQPAARRELARRITPVQRVYRWSSAISALAAVLVLALGVLGLLTRSAGAPGASLMMSAGSHDEAQAPSAVAVQPTQALTTTPAPTRAPVGTATPLPTLTMPNSVEESAGSSAAAALTATPLIMALEAQEIPAQAPVQAAPAGMGGASYKETPAGMGGAAGMTQPLATPAALTDMAAPQVSMAEGALETGASETNTTQAGADAEAFNAASVPAAIPPTATGAAFDSGQRLAPTATKPPSLPSPVLTQMALTQEALAYATLTQDALAQTLARDAAVTGTPLAFQPTVLPAPAEPPAAASQGAENTRGETGAPPGLPVEVMLGGGLALLALSGLLYVLGRRAG